MAKEDDEVRRLAELADYWAAQVKKEEALLASLRKRADEAYLEWRRAADKHFNAEFHRTGIHLRG